MGIRISTVAIRRDEHGIPRAVLWACAALFLLMQGLVATHAAAHGDHPHDHDGMPCLIQAHGERVAAIAPGDGMILCDAPPAPPPAPEPSLTEAPVWPGFADAPPRAPPFG